jgi:hypothetical protein
MEGKVTQMFFTKKPVEKTAWAVVPEGDASALADALANMVANARMVGIDPARVRMAPIRRGKRRGEPVWELTFSVADEVWRRRGLPEQVTEAELQKMTPHQIDAALRAGKLKALLSDRG